MAPGAALDRLLVASFAALLKAGVAKLDWVAQDGVRVRAAAGAASFRRHGTLEPCRGEAEERAQRSCARHAEAGEHQTFLGASAVAGLVAVGGAHPGGCSSVIWGGRIKSSSLRSLRGNLHDTHRGRRHRYRESRSKRRYGRYKTEYTASSRSTKRSR